MIGSGHLVLLAYCAGVVLASAVGKEIISSTGAHLDVLMKGAKPLKPDAYLCTSYEIDENELYIVKFEALANADTAHHILMYGCSNGPASKKDIWDCPSICGGGEQQIMFAWAKNAPPTQLPDGVGFRIGKETAVRTIVMQIHYAKSFTVNETPDKSGIRLHVTHDMQPNVAGIFLMLAYSFEVPPNQPKYHVDMSCSYEGTYNMYPFAYRTHSHGLGSVITGYQYNNTGYHMIGKGNPQWPQAFYPSDAKIEVKPGDKLVARCTYNSTGTDHAVQVGATGNDEMCNFYMMFYTSSSVKNPSGQCGGVQIQSLVDNMPSDSDATLPPNPLLDEEAHGHHHHHHSMAPTSSTAEQPTKTTGDLQDEIVHPLLGSSPYSRPYMQMDSDTQSLSSSSIDSYLPGSPISEERLPKYFETWLESAGKINIQKRLGGEYYDDYAANDEREQGTYPDVNAGLSRNRNKAFEAMNKELKGFEHIKPHGSSDKSRSWQHEQTSSRKKTIPQSFPSNLPRKEPLEGALLFQADWPSEQTKIGQVGGVASDSEGNVYIFHRGERIWDAQSFDYEHNFRMKNQSIKEDTVMVFSRDGKLIRKFGSGKFFMPHGIEVDRNGNIWLTDVALHQVFRIPAGATEPDLTLGERFVHNDDDTHFCKPSDVAVMAAGEFFVSDGYCNGRVLKFSKDGNLQKQWGRQNIFASFSSPLPGVFDIPHSVTVAEDLKLVCVADRENGRIQCFDLEGNFVYIIKYPVFGSRLFAVEYCPRHGGLLFAVNGPAFDGKEVEVRGFTISISEDGHQLLESWTLPMAQGLQNPHDVAVDVKGHAVYVGELSPPAVWKFQRQTDTHTNVTAHTTTKPSSVPELATLIADKKNNVEPDSMSQGKSLTSEGDRKTLTSALAKNVTLQEEMDTSDFTPSLIIGVLLVIPVILLLVITLVMRVHHKGWNKCCSGMRTPKVFNMQNFLGNSHKGFDKLSQDDSDHDADILSDSDNEEFRQPIKSKA